MPLPFFKKKEQKKIEQTPWKVEGKEGKEVEPVRKKKTEEAKLAARPQKEGVAKVAPIVLRRPHVTEKASRLSEQNQYTFRVVSEANKIEVKKAVEELYGVDVRGVRMVRIPPKRRRRGRIEGWRKGYKKAIVTIKEGQKIEVLPR